MSDNATKPYLKADDIPKLPAGKADQRIPYGDDPLQFGCGSFRTTKKDSYVKREAQELGQAEALGDWHSEKDVGVCALE